ncbi:MAG: hypothetical protein IJ151_08285 [Bacteroidales bacterium]|nr:hypothetical protein [Bacteroidales bacterium]
MKWLNNILKYVVGMMSIGIISGAECALLDEWSLDSTILSIVYALIAPFLPLIICTLASFWDKTWARVLMITGCLVQYIFALSFVIDLPLDQLSPFMPVLAAIYTVFLICIIVSLIIDRKKKSIK